ncbi:MAG: hypothetical protein IT460_17235 [Planctomycetes bacterium]|nr:hypothetical protein [Planctomycetota bacterium]
MRVVPRSWLLSASLSVLAAGSGGCRAYRPAPLADAVRLTREPEEAPPGPLTFDDAANWACLHNPKVLAAAARAQASALEPGRAPIGFGVGLDSDGRGEAEAELDLTSIVGIGTAAARRRLVASIEAEALRALDAVVRTNTIALAEAFAVEREIRSLPPIEAPPDPQAFVRAGLETSAAERTVNAIRLAHRSATAARESALVASRTALAEALGLTGAPPPPIVVPDESWPPVPADVDPSAVADRADVRRSAASFDVADAELRRAVAAQYPDLVLAPGLALDPSAMFGAVRLRLPVGAGRQVVAAEALREAARHEYAATVATAVADLRRTRAAWEASVASRAAARARFEADADLLHAARLRLETGDSGLMELVLAARDLVDAGDDLRDAAVEVGRARVAVAVATGWPGPRSPR